MWNKLSVLSVGESIDLQIHVGLMGQKRSKIIDRKYLLGIDEFKLVEQNLFTYLKGIGLVLAVFFGFYPGILIAQLLTNTVTESVSQILVLLGLSGVAWVWIIRLYRAYRSVGLCMTAAE